MDRPVVCKSVTGAIPLDIKTAAQFSKEGELAGRRWPVRYSDYGFVEHSLVAAISEMAQAAAANREQSIVARANLHEQAIYVSKACCLAVELAGLKSTDCEVFLDHQSNPMASYLLGEDADIDNAGALKRPAPYTGVKKVLWEAKHRFKRWRAMHSLGGAGVDQLSENPLLQEYLLATDTRPAATYPYLMTIPNVSTDERAISNLVEAVIDAVDTHVPDSVKGDRELMNRLRVLIRQLSRRMFGQVLNDLRSIDAKVSREDLGTMLISGAPKEFGRLLSALYQEEGKKVIRFSHGGERGLFVDQPYGLAEFPFCDEYFMHGSGEARMVQSRIDAARIPIAFDRGISIKGLGSQKHASILRNAEEKHTKSRRKNITYVAQLYTAERAVAPPAFKIPDALLLEWQIWLLQFLKRSGYRVTVKAHPRGFFSCGLTLAPFADEIIEGFFDPFEHLNDTVFIMDFPGTVFMDLMASSAGMVFCDFGNRTYDPLGAKLVDARVEKVNCHINESNVFRVDEKSLLDAIERAAEGDYLDRARTFVSSYFS